MSESNPGKIPELYLEKLALGELSAAEKAELERRLGPGTVADALARLQADNARILARYPAAIQADQIDSKYRAATVVPAAEKARKRKWLVATVPGLAVALALAFVWPLLGGTRDTDPAATVSATRLKGKPELRVYRKAGGRPARLQSGALVESGVTLQIAIQPASAPHGVIVSVDGRGVSTLHFPVSERASTALGAGAGGFKKTRDYGWTLARSYQLDDAPLYERFFFVVSDSAIDVAAVQRATRKLRSSDERPRLPAGCKLVDEVVLRKPGPGKP